MSRRGCSRNTNDPYPPNKALCLTWPPPSGPPPQAWRGGVPPPRPRSDRTVARAPPDRAAALDVGAPDEAPVGGAGRGRSVAGHGVAVRAACGAGAGEHLVPSEAGQIAGREGRGADVVDDRASVA